MPLFSKKKREGSNGSGRRKRENGGSGLGGRLLSLSSSDRESNSGADGSAAHPRGPGAQSVGANTAVFRVTVPDNVMPGEEFQVYAGNQIGRAHV